MNTANYVDAQISALKNSGIPLSDAAWEAAKMCIEWPYIFGDRGQYCTPSHRVAVYNKDPSKSYYQNVRKKCQAIRESKPTGSCSGCKWSPGGEKVRGYDCRGFTYWILKQIYGWELMGAGATSQWNTETNWKAKGTIDTIPEGKLVCLFYTDKDDPKIMAHTGLGYKGETIECSNGVQYKAKREKKWTHWGLPACVDENYVAPVEPSKPAEKKYVTLRKGSKGANVTKLQNLLMNKGYALPKYGADGDFGAETLNAVKNFQKDHGLTVDGVVGKETWIALESSSEQQHLYTVTIPHLSKEMADDLLNKYIGTMTME